MVNFYSCDRDAFIIDVKTINGFKLADVKSSARLSSLGNAAEAVQRTELEAGGITQWED